MTADGDAHDVAHVVIQPKSVPSRLCNRDGFVRSSAKLIDVSPRNNTSEGGSFHVLKFNFTK